MRGSRGIVLTGMAYLHLHDPVREEIRDIPLRKPLVTLGRAEGNDVHLLDPSLAPTHANLLRKGNHFTLSVVDRATTFIVNGVRARSSDLRVGDEVVIGRFRLTLMEGEPKPLSDARRSMAGIKSVDSG